MSVSTTTSTSHDFFVSIHIPKTAGTALGQILSQAFNYRVLMDYAPFESYSTSDPAIKESRHFVRTFFRGVHGHCNVRRHLDNFPDAQFISCVRHPVDRIISQYLHEMNANRSDAIYHKDIVEGRMSVIDFAERPDVGAAMFRHLDGLEIEKYDMVLITEHLLSSLKLLQRRMKDLNISQHFGDPPVLPIVNSHRNRKTVVTFDESTKREIFNRAPQDVDIYRRAQELFKKQLSRHLN